MTRHEILTAETHRALRVHASGGASDAVMAAVTVPDEFRRVQAHYPILFRLAPERDSFSALALFGLENGENLFLDGDRWDAPYRPLSMAVQPFLVGQDPGGDGPGQVHVDMGHPRIVATGLHDGVRVFDEDGRPSPHLDRIAGMLGELDEGWRASGAFFDALRRYELIEPIAAEVPMPDGATNRLAGFHGIDEGRLATLDAHALDDLHRAGHLMPIFMAVASLGRLADLIDRKLGRADG